MPSEQLPWDRRDFRKHERYGSEPRFGGPGFGSGGANRWRDHHNSHAPPPPSPQPPPYHQHNPHQPQRWYSDFRSSRPAPNGHGKQSGWHMYPDETGHGFSPFGSRHNYRSPEDDHFRSLGFREDGRSIRNSRESRGVFSQRDWRSPNWETSTTSTNGSGKSVVEVNNQKPVVEVNNQKSVVEVNNQKPVVEVNNQKSVENTPTCHSNHSKVTDLGNSNSELPSDSSQKILKDKHEDDGAARLNHKFDKENVLGSTDWKPLKWSRSGSLSSRGSTFSHSTNSNVVGVDCNDMVSDLKPKSTICDEPAAAATGGCIISVAPSTFDDASSRKKPRLGWGEGLAKYEKKKVEGPDDGAVKVGLPSASVADTMQLSAINLSEKSPEVECLPLSTLPATPPLACGASTGIQENQSIEAVNDDEIRFDLKSSASIMPLVDRAGTNINLENNFDDVSSITKLSCLVNDLLQSDGQCSVENVNSVSLSKLLAWKVDVLKALEVTESEVDSLETKCKSLSGESGLFYSPLSVSDLSIKECHLKPCSEMVKASNSIAQPDSVQPLVPGDASIGDSATVPKYKLTSPEADDIDCPCSAKSDDSLSSIVPSDASDSVECLSRNSSSSYRFSQTSSRDCIRYGDSAYESIISSNKDAVAKMLEELNKFLPSQQHRFDLSSPSYGSSLPRDAPKITNKFLMRRRALQFNEKALILKYKVFKHFWKEGRVVSVKKLRGKSQKKFNQSQTLHKKNRSCIRSRLPYSAGSPLTVPAEEVVDFVNRLLSCSPFKQCRSILRMPALILDRQTKKSRFISNNGLVDDPCASERERYMINSWTAVEREIFIDKLALFGKDFKKISSFLDHKTVADCVEFYYKNHKSECFVRAKRKSDCSEQRKSQSSTYLVTAGKRWNREANAVSLDILGEATAIAANASGYVESQPKYNSRMFFPSSHYHNSPKVDEGLLQGPENMNIYSSDTAAVDVLAGICGSLSSEAMSSCITSSIDPVDGNQDLRLQRVNSCIKCPLTPDVTQTVDKECSEESYEDSTDWTDEEKSVFIQAVSIHGKDFSMISRCVRTRSKDQCKVFFSKARKCLGLDLIQPAVGNVVSGDINGGGSDTEGACVVSGHESEFAENHTFDLDVKICGENRGPCPLDSMAAEPMSRISLVTEEPFDLKHVKEISSYEHESKMELRSVLASSEIESVSAEEVQVNKRQDCTSTKENLKDNGGETTGRMIPEHMLAAANQSCPPAEEKVVAAGICNGNTSSAVILQHNDHSKPLDSSSVLFPVPIKYQRNELSSVGYQNIGSSGASGEKNFQKRDCHSNHLELESSHILKGYPISSATFKDINRDVHCKTCVSVESDLRQVKKNSSYRSNEFLPLQRCSNNSRHHSETDSEQFQSQEKLDDRTSYQPNIALEMDKPSRNGDVKLFGKILVSSDQHSSCIQKNEDEDGSQKCMNPVPDSAMLLQKRSKECNGVGDDHNVLPNRSVTVDVNKQHQELLFSEVQKLQSRGMIGVVENGGALFGSGISDPISAIKMQYSKAAPVPSVREDDGYGDVGRRL